MSSSIFIKRPLLLTTAIIFLAVAILPIHGSEFQAQAVQFVENYCIDCHGGDQQKGDISLHDIAMDFKSADNAQLWLTVLSQLENRNMPPEKKKQPTHVERHRMAASIIEQFRLAGNPVELLRSSPKLGNYVNHQALFSGEHRGAAFSRPRIWRISPYIDGKSSPFGLSQNEGFKDYAHMWSLDKPTIELLLVKADGIVASQIGPSEADLKMQDEIWKQGILTKRRNLQTDLKKHKEQMAKDPDNAQIKKRFESLTTQLEKNEATNFENNRGKPSGKLPGLQQNPTWTTAYGDNMPSQQIL